MLGNADEINSEVSDESDESDKEILPILVQLNAVSAVGKMLNVNNKDHRAALNVRVECAHKNHARQP